MGGACGEVLLKGGIFVSKINGVVFPLDSTFARLAVGHERSRLEWFERWSAKGM